MYKALWSLMIMLVTTSSYATYVQIKVDDEIAVVELADNEQAYDFINLLPLTLTLENYADERIATLSCKLISKNAPDGMQPVAGELNYYAPWGNIGYFVKDFRYSQGLWPLGLLKDRTS